MRECKIWRASTTRRFNDSRQQQQELQTTYINNSATTISLIHITTKQQQAQVPLKKVFTCNSACQKDHPTEHTWITPSQQRSYMDKFRKIGGQYWCQWCAEEDHRYEDWGDLLRHQRICTEGGPTSSYKEVSTNVFSKM